jgi:chaperonin cofactor prefoldin
MKSTINQIKNPTESFANRLDKVEDRISGIEDKVDELEHLDNDKDKKVQTEKK